ncbi:MAG: DUF4282 domain-containing protein [Candidatus Margulisiibacteriota bacterium]
MKKNLLNKLFDFSFSEFIGPSVISFLYGLGMVILGIVLLIVVVMMFFGNAGMGIIFLILSPLIFLFYLIIMRFWMEMLMIWYRIEQNTRK